MRPAILAALLVGCSAAPVAPPPPVPSKATGLELEAVAGLGLFAQERLKSQALIAQAVSSRDAGVLPFEVTERAWALASQGRNPLTGAACGKALAPNQARRRWAAELGLTGIVSSHVWCAKDGGCELSVNGWPLEPDRAGERFRWVAPISSSGDALTALEAALPALVPPPRDERGRGGLLGSLGASSPLQEEDRLEVNLWPADRRDRAKGDDPKTGFPTLTLPQVLTCLGATDSRVATLVEISQAGAVTRCEGEPSEEPEAAACICGQLRRSAPATWLSGKRWSVSVGVDRRDQTTSDRRFVLRGSWRKYLQLVKGQGDEPPRFKVKVEDPSIEAWSPGPDRLAVGCFTNAFPQPGKLDSRWAVWFDGAGRPTRILEQKGYPPLPKELADCVARALRTAQAPCPSRAGLWAMADLRVSASDPNAPQPSLMDVLGQPKKP